MTSTVTQLFTPTQLVVAMAAVLSQSPVYAGSSLDPEFSLGDVQPGIGVVLDGNAANDTAGHSVSHAGDVNDDGIDDFLIGAPGASPKLRSRAGESYVLFGGSDTLASGLVALGGLNGNDGYRLFGEAEGDTAGFSVSDAGDMNGDGIDDLIVSARAATSSGRVEVGKVYVVFGGADVGASSSLALSSVTGLRGFQIAGLVSDVDFDFFGFGQSVSAAGDVNGDGMDDLIIGAVAAKFDNRVTGAAYVLFGSPLLENTTVVRVEDLDGSNGFVLQGSETGDRVGATVSGAGDFNGDGFDDLVVGAPGSDDLVGYDPYDRAGPGRTYVVYGAENVGSTGTIELDSLTSNTGVAIKGASDFERSGASVSEAGDFNGDGFDDIIIGAPDANPVRQTATGGAYVVYGGSSLGSLIRLRNLDDTKGLVIAGGDQFDRMGQAVSQAGDVNGDGISDVIINAPSATVNGLTRAGVSYVVFGGSSGDSNGVLDVATLDGSSGFVLTGNTDNNGFVQRDVSGVGDVNADGVDDVIVSGANAEVNGLEAVGQSHIVFMPVPDSLEASDGSGTSTIRAGETQFRNFHAADPSDNVRLRLFRQTAVQLETANDGTQKNYDTILELFENESLIASNDDIEPGEQLYSRLVQTLEAGDYTVRVRPKDGITIPSYALSLSALETCDETLDVHQYTLPHNQFALLSLPCQPPAGTTINDLFGDDIAGPYSDVGTPGGTWIVFTWDPIGFSYVNPGSDGILEPGQGFWIIQIQSDGQAVVLDLPDGSVGTAGTGAASTACTSFTGCSALPLSGVDFAIDPSTNAPLLTVPNLLGNPYDQFITPFDDLRVTTTGGACSIANGGCTLSEATLPADGGANVLGDVAFSYSTTLNEYTLLSSGSTLEPWQGFWVFELPAAIDNNPVVRFPFLR